MYAYYTDCSHQFFPNNNLYPQQNWGLLNQEAMVPPFPNQTTTPADEESFIENILRLNRGKIGTFFLTYENNSQWNAKIIRGIIETAGRDHIILSDPQSGKRFLLLMLNLDYVEFDEPVNYFMPQINPNKQIVTG